MEQSVRALVPWSGRRTPSDAHARVCRDAHNWWMGSQGRRGWRQRQPATGRGFRPLGELESDRSGVLIAARSEVSGALVDIRVLAPELTADRASMSRLGRDMGVLREVRHTNLVSVMNFDKRAGAVIYESVPGSTLAQVLKGQGSLELAASLVLLDDCAAGLAALHNDGVLHRNVTPDAVVIETTGAVLLRDAGLWVQILARAAIVTSRQGSSRLPRGITVVECSVR